MDARVRLSFLHDDPVALKLVQLKLVRRSRLG
jgi:hypothetical protein